MEGLYYITIDGNDKNSGYRLTTHRLLKFRLMRFVSIGALGFLLDVIVLTLLMKVVNFDPFLGRTISFPIVVFITWWLNRRLTFFSARKAPPGRQYALYLAVQLVGWLCNFAVFALLLDLLPSILGVPLPALVAGAAVGLCINYIGSARLAFANPCQPGGI